MRFASAYPSPFFLQLQKFAIPFFVLATVALLWSATSRQIPGDTLRGIETGKNTKNVRLSELLSVGMELSEQANEIIRQVKHEGKKAEDMHVKGKTEEGVDEPVTQADSLSNSIFVNGFRDEFPGIHILSEETEPQYQKINLKGSHSISGLKYDPEIPIDELLITIDPLDATKEFTEDLLEYVTTMVCITKNGRPIAGIINQPFIESQAPIWGIAAFDSYERQGVNNLEMSEALGAARHTVTISRSHTGNAADVVTEYLPDHVSLPAGGAGYKALLVLSGKANAYVHVTKIKVWDVCAADALVHAAGGEFTDISGNSIEYTVDQPVLTHGLIATSTPEKHDWYVEHLTAEAEKLNGQ